MSRRPGASWWLAGGIGVLVGGIATAIGWGQLGPVRVPQVAEWADIAVPLCPDPEVDRAEVHALSTLLGAHGLKSRVEPGPCDGQMAIHMRVSAADIERKWPSSEAMGEYGQIVGEVAMEAFDLERTGEVVTGCELYLRNGTDAVAMTHGALHCFGYQHPRAAPAGHVMNRDYSRISLQDWRGIP